VVCAQCGEAEAVVLIRRSGGDAEGHELSLCESCARGRGISASKGVLDLDIDELIGADLEAEADRPQLRACPSCGTSLDRIRLEGRLGCASCADAFADHLRHGEGPSPGALDLSPPDSRRAFLEAELGKAISAENYESAARIRDELSSLGEGGPLPRPLFSETFPLGAFAASLGPEDDVALWTSARVSRCLEGTPFPGTASYDSSASRGRLAESLRSQGCWSVREMGELSASERRSLSERGLLPRSYASDDGAVLATRAETGCYVLLGDVDHLRIRSMRPGLDPRAALLAALAEAASLESVFPFASRPGLGWICARASECGLAASLSVTIHIPALTAAGLRERVFMGLMAAGLAIKGFYSDREESAGSVYELVAEPGGFSSLDAMADAVAGAVAKTAAAERRARDELGEKGREALDDAEGRAYGIVAHCGLLGAEEAASLVSVLRLAALRGALSGVSPRRLGELLLSQGSATVSAAAGLREAPRPRGADSIRAASLRSALAGAGLRAMEGHEGGPRCSKA
jgi:protein-arginine kinase/protein-arginine kinase activator protein McsA